MSDKEVREALRYIRSGLKATAIRADQEAE